MKRNILKTVFVATMALLMPSTMSAQLDELTNILGSVTGKSSKAKTVTDVLGNLLGTSKLTEQNLIGTWVYTQPCVAFESENVLSNIGGTVAASKVEDKMTKALSKAGIKEGKFSITFNADKTFQMTVGKKNIAGTYQVSDSDVLLTFNSPQKTIKTNGKITVGTLQLAMNADKMLEIVNTIASKASAYSSQMGNISTVLSQYKGMYLGMKFQKK